MRSAQSKRLVLATWILGLLLHAGGVLAGAPGPQQGQTAQAGASPNSGAAASSAGAAGPAQPTRGAEAGLQLRLLSPTEFAVVRTPQQLVRVAVRCGEGEITRVVAVLDGKRVAQSLAPEDPRGVQVAGAATPTPALAADERVYPLSVTLPANDVVLTLQAESSLGAVVRIQLPLRWGGAPNSAVEFSIRPKLYALTVGVSAYRDPRFRLTYPGKDANDFAQLLAKQRGSLYRDVETKVLVDQQATKGNILDSLEWLQRQATTHDVVILFLAGHGINDGSTGRYHFLPYDADLTAVKRTLLSQEDLQTTLRAIPGKVLLFLDTCHSGNVMSGWTARDVTDVTEFSRELANAENSIVVFAAASRRQASRESAAWGNGAFTRALLEGLYGAAAFVQGRPITVNMLDLYLSERVKRLSNGEQTPSTTKLNDAVDFPIAMPLVAKVDGDNMNFSVLPTAAPTPVYKRWWFWTAIGVGVAGIVTGVVIATWPRTPPDAQHVELVF